MWQVSDPQSQTWPPRRLAPVFGAVAGLSALAFVLLHVRLENHFFDMTVYQSAVKWWADGHPLYDYSQPDKEQGHLGFTYPPAGAWVLRPLAYVSHNTAVVAVVVLSVLCTGAAVWWLTRTVARRHGWSRLAVFAVAVPLTAGLGAVWIGFDFGQINPLLWALVVLDLAVLAPRRNRFLGIGIGLATAIKLVPGIFIVYLLITRRVRGAITAAATAGLATLAAHVASPADSTQYWSQSLLGGEGIGNLWYFTNQSISGVLARVYKPDHYPTWLWLLLSAIVAIYGLWRARQAGLAGDDLTGMALAGFVASLISPVTWVHHIFWWVPALLAIADTAFAKRSSAGEKLATVRSGLRRPIPLAVVGLLTSPIVAISAAANPGSGFVSVILVNWLVWLMLLLIVTLPVDVDRAVADREALLSAAEGRAARRNRSKDALLAL